MTRDATYFCGLVRDRALAALRDAHRVEYETLRDRARDWAGSGRARDRAMARLAARHPDEYDALRRQACQDVGYTPRRPGRPSQANAERRSS